MPFRYLLAAAAIVLPVTAASAMCTAQQTAMLTTHKTTDAAKPRGLHPAELQRVRKVYIGLRQSAFDECRQQAATDAGCFKQVLPCLVADTNDPSLARHHAYISELDPGVATPSPNS